MLHLRHISSFGLHPAQGSDCIQERKYFDSGDFALSQAQTASDIGQIKTGTQHPHRESISHPTSASPSSGNVDSATQQPQGQRKSSVVQSESHLHDIMYSESQKAQGQSQDTNREKDI